MFHISSETRRHVFMLMFVQTLFNIHLRFSPVVDSQHLKSHSELKDRHTLVILLLIMKNWSVTDSVLMSGWNTLRSRCSGVIRSVCCVNLLPPWWCSNWLQPAAAHTLTHTHTHTLSSHWTVDSPGVVLLLCWSSRQQVGDHRSCFLLSSHCECLCCFQLSANRELLLNFTKTMSWLYFSSVLLQCVQAADQHHWLWMSQYQSCLLSELCLVLCPVTWVLLFRLEHSEEFLNWKVTFWRHAVARSSWSELRDDSVSYNCCCWSCFCAHWGLLLWRVWTLHWRNLIGPELRAAARQRGVCVQCCVMLCCFVFMC